MSIHIDTNRLALQMSAESSGVAPRSSPNVHGERGAELVSVQEAMRTAEQRTPPPAVLVPNATSLIAAATQIGVMADPTLLMTAVQIHLRDAQTAVRESSAEASEKASQRAETIRHILLEQAEKAAAEASEFLGIGGVLGDIVEAVVKAVAIAASTIVSVVSLGTLTAVAVVGLALLLTADSIAKGASELGILSEEDAQWLAVGLKIAGSILMTVATCGTGAVATASELTKAVTEVCQHASTVAQAAQGTDQVRAAKLSYDAETRTVSGERQGLAVEMHRSRSEAEVDAIKELMELYARLRERIEEIQRAQGELRSASVRVLA